MTAGTSALGFATPGRLRVSSSCRPRCCRATRDRLQPFELGAELTPGIRSVPAVGHTPGHSRYLVSSSTAHLLLLGDTLQVAPVQFARLKMTMIFDLRQEYARAQRQAL